MERILMVGAHFDDVELGAGGTATKLAEQGKKVYKLTLFPVEIKVLMPVRFLE